MQMFINVSEAYLHRDLVDFRKSINGLSMIVENDMALSALGGALFLFCNKKRGEAVLSLTETQLHWLLGYDITKMPYRCIDKSKYYNASV